MNRRFFLSALAFAPFSKPLAAATMTALEPPNSADSIHVAVCVPELVEYVGRVRLTWDVTANNPRYHRHVTEIIA